MAAGQDSELSGGTQADVRQPDIVALETVEQFTEAVALQKAIWSYGDDTELLPVRFFVVAVKVGGQAFGVYDQGRMVAFLLAIPGRKPDGRSYLHSHMLGVLPEYRDRGLGRALKFRQRDEARARGIDLIEWTFDPLQLRNAWFNVEVLGAIVRRYYRNQYGTSTSALSGGLPTDRVIAEWWITKDRFRPPIVKRIYVPPLKTIEVQQEMAGRFEECFARGLAVVGIERAEIQPGGAHGEVGNVSADSGIYYLLGTVA